MISWFSYLWRGPLLSCEFALSLWTPWTILITCDIHFSLSFENQKREAKNKIMHFETYSLLKHFCSVNVYGDWPVSVLLKNVSTFWIKIIWLNTKCLKEKLMQKMWSFLWFTKIFWSRNSMIWSMIWPMIIFIKSSFDLIWFIHFCF